MVIFGQKTNSYRSENSENAQRVLKQCFFKGLHHPETVYVLVMGDDFTVPAHRLVCGA